jgi:hypothetical protein
LVCGQHYGLMCAGATDQQKCDKNDA